MKKTIIIAIALTIAVPAITVADEYVNGYVRRDGTYVQPHYRSSPDSSPYNNYSSKGNYNPYTGRQGTVTPPADNSGYGSGTYISPYGRR